MAAQKPKSKNKPRQPNSGRKLQYPSYKSFKLSKKIKPTTPKLKSSFKLLSESTKHIWRNKKLFIGISLVYFLISFVFVRGLSIDNGLAELRADTQELFEGSGGAFLIGLTLFSELVVSSNSTSDSAAGLYSLVLYILASLALIWALRQTVGGAKVTVKESYYRSMHPLVPFLLVLLIICLQLIPALIGSTLYSIVATNGLAVNFAEQFVWIVLLALLLLLSLYMTSSSIFALYIVTLPDTQPMQALRSARELVRYRRWTVMRKLIFLPLALLVVTAIIMLPFLFFVTQLATLVFLVVSAVMLALAHSYIYGLYRDLVK